MLTLLPLYWKVNTSWYSGSWDLVVKASTHYAEGYGFDFLVGIPDVPQAPIVAYVQ